MLYLWGIAVVSWLFLSGLDVRCHVDLISTFHWQIGVPFLQNMERNFQEGKKDRVHVLSY